MSDRLAEAWGRNWTGADVVAMRRDVDARLEAAIRRWGLRSPSVLPGGNVAVVLGARTGTGDLVVLKVNPRGHPEEAALAAQVSVLRGWAPSGLVPAVLAVADEGQTVLMERILPGTPLDAGGPWSERLRVIAALTRRLHAGDAPTHGAVAIDEYTRGWGRALTQSGRTSDAALLRELLETAPDPTVLHADLHGGNVLRRADGRWAVIDPHAVVGDPAAETWALIDPLAPVATIGAVHEFARAAGLDRERAVGWTRVRARAEASQGADDDADWAARLHATADNLTP